jgi:Bax protein
MAAGTANTDEEQLMKYLTRKVFALILVLTTLPTGSLIANSYYGYGYPPPAYYGPQAYPPVYPGQPYHPYYGPQPYMPRYQPVPYPPAPYQPAPYQPSAEIPAQQTETVMPVAEPAPVESPVSRIETTPVVAESSTEARSTDSAIPAITNSEPVEMIESATTNMASNPPANAKTPEPKQAIDNTVSDHKLEFIENLLPVIQKQNTEILKRRNWLFAVFTDIENGLTLSDEDQALLKRLQKSYRVSESPLSSEQGRKEMIDKIDIIPASLTLAQAANESAWGRSRFAREANNLFGIWTYDESKGLVPKKREQGKKHFVRKFDSIDESVAYYMQMLNSHPAYAEMRKIRAELRASQQPVRGHALAAGLEKYSAKGDKYIVLIRQLITQNDWHNFDRKRDAV